MPRGHWNKRSAKGRGDCERHFRRRLFERYGITLEGNRYRVLCDDVRSGRGRFLFKESLTRTHWLLNIDGRGVRVVYDKGQSALSTALPPLASCDTHPKGGDVKQTPAPLSGAVGEAETPQTPEVSNGNE